MIRFSLLTLTAAASAAAVVVPLLIKVTSGADALLVAIRIKPSPYIRVLHRRRL